MIWTSSPNIKIKYPHIWIGKTYLKWYVLTLTMNNLLAKNWHIVYNLSRGKNKPLTNEIHSAPKTSIFKRYSWCHYRMSKCCQNSVKHTHYLHVRNNYNIPQIFKHSENHCYFSYIVIGGALTSVFHLMRENQLFPFPNSKHPYHHFLIITSNTWTFCIVF